MVSLTLDEARSVKSEFAYNEFCLYLLRDQERVIYAGKSEWNVLKRLREHLGLPNRWGWNGAWPSPIGMHILENAPASDQWTIEMLTLRDCLPTLLWYNPHVLRASIQEAERGLICCYRPPFNYADNGPSPWHDLSGLGDEVAPFIEYVAQCRAGQPPLQFLLDRLREDGLDPESLMQTQTQIMGQGDNPFRWLIYQTEATEVEAPEAGH